MTPAKYIRTIRQLAYLKETPDMHSGRTINERRVHDAKSLHAKVYLRRGYITESDLNSDRHLHTEADPYQHHSHYFVVTDKRKLGKPVVATARQIHADKDLGHDSFPTVKDFELYPDMQQAILALDPAKCVEISGLAKDGGVTPSAVMMLYRSMWHHSLRRQHHLWLMACDVKAFERLKFLFGDALVRIGDNAFYMGSEVVPAMLEVHRSVDSLMADSKTFNPFKRRMKKDLVKFFTAGLSVKFRQISRKTAVPSREIIKAIAADAL